MIKAVYLERGNFIIDNPGDTSRTCIGLLGDGQDNDPVGMLPGRLCSSCGRPLEQLQGGVWSCPRGHGQLMAGATWNQNDLFQIEVYHPFPFSYGSSSPATVRRAAQVCIPLRVLRTKLHRRGGTIVTDVTIPRCSEVLWEPPSGLGIGDGVAQLAREGEMWRVQLRFYSSPDYPLPTAEGFAFGAVLVCVDLPIRLDWRGAGE